MAHYEWRKPPKDIEWHFIINEVCYVEQLIKDGSLAYDDDYGATIALLARYYRNYKGLPKDECERLIYHHIANAYMKVMECDVFMLASNKIVNLIERACSNRRYKNCHGYKPLRDFDGIWVTAAEIETIMSLPNLEMQEVAFGILCFAKMYNESNRRQGRKVNNLYYMDNSVLRRAIGWQKGTIEHIENVKMQLVEIDYIGSILNYDKYSFIQIGRQPLVTQKCNIVNDDSEQVLYIDNFDTLGFTWQYLLGNRKVKKCDCGRYFHVNSNAQKKCPACGDASAKPIERKPKTRNGKMAMRMRPKHSENTAV